MLGCAGRLDHDDLRLGRFLDGGDLVHLEHNGFGEDILGLWLHFQVGLGVRLWLRLGLRFGLRLRLRFGLGLWLRDRSLERRVLADALRRDYRELLLLGDRSRALGPRWSVAERPVARVLERVPLAHVAATRHRSNFRSW